jgi:hypothetical protein
MSAVKPKDQSFDYAQDKFISLPLQKQHHDLSSAYVVPSLYITFPREGWKLILPEEEASDKEILRFIEKSGHLDFLNDPEEDIYGPEDGQAL